LKSAAQASKRNNFDREIAEKFGPDATPGDFVDVNLEAMPEYDLYDDGTGDGLQGSPDKEEEPELMTPTPEAGDVYLNASVMLTRGNTFTRGTVVSRKRGVKGNPIG